MNLQIYGSLSFHKVLFLFLIPFLFPCGAFAYGRDTHEGITDATIRSFEESRGDVFAGQEERVVIGSSAEDDGTRPLNHFYDPVNYLGLTVGFSMPTSEEWAQDTEGQGNYCDLGVCKKRIGYEDTLFSSPTDFSWNRAIYEYVHGDKKRALETLGHILHLIQDATVPAHVRNDQHLNHQGFGDPDPYESFAAQFKKGNISSLSPLNFPAYSDIGTYIYRTALFTNNNFVSKDTLFSKFHLPNLNDMETEGGYIRHPKYGHRVVRIEMFFNKKEGRNDVQFFINDQEQNITSDYWRLLSERAIVMGAGVIDLFFREVEREKKAGTLKAKNTSAAERDRKELVLNLFPFIKGLYGSSLSKEDVKELIDPSRQSAGVLSGTQLKKWADDMEKRSAQEKVEGELHRTEPRVLGVESENEVVPSVEISIASTTEEGGEATTTPPLLPWPGFGGGAGSPSSVTMAVATPAITSPSEGSSVATTTVIFTGTATAGHTITGTIGTTSITTIALGGSWSLSFLLQEGSITGSFTATDAEGNVSSQTQRSLTVDLTPPSVANPSITECTSSLVSSFCMVASTTLRVSWAPVSGVSHYSLFGNGSFLSSTTATSANVTASNNATTSIEVISYDVAGNAATSTAVSAYVYRQPLIINEIGWAGTKTSSSDQWIEIKNRTGYTLNLSDVVLYSATGNAYIDLSGTIGPLSTSNNDDIYLIEKLSTVTSATANLTYSFEPLALTGEELYLVHVSNSGTSTLDQTPSVSTCSGWCAGASASSTSSSITFGTFTNAVSMERADMSASGSLATSWRSNDTYQTSITDASGYWIFGTPGIENSSEHPLAGWFCSPDSASVTQGTTYTPPSGTCTYLSAFVRYPNVSVSRYGGLYRGTVGSSTEINRHSLGSNAGSISSTQSNDTITSPVSGESFFVAIWEVRSSSSDVIDFAGYFTTGSPSVPHTNYRVIEWTYGP